MIILAVAAVFIVFVFLLTGLAKLGIRRGNRSLDKAVLREMNSKSFRRRQLEARRIRDDIDAEHQRRRGQGIGS
jgi:hypothetical protein